MDLHECRKSIDAIDLQIVELLNRRAAEVKRAGHFKNVASLPLIDHQREAEIYRRVAAENLGQMETEGLLRIFEQIVAESRKIQSPAARQIVEKGEPVQ
jgi:chorismate mutase/prephenate dehydratase